MINYSQNLQDKIIAYYERYYQDCGLKDFQVRAKARLTEEEREKIQLKKLEEIFNFDFAKKKHFIVGAGTGGLAIVLAKEYQGQVFGIEPEEEELEIIKSKCQETGIVADNFKKEFAESISFGNDFFDFVYCITVLEHVQNIGQSIKEMIRVLKPKGYLYINTPNYRFPVEKHYKIFFPTFLPKFLGKLYLLLRGKPTGFVSSINFLTEKKLNKILFKEKDIKWARIYEANFASGKEGIKNSLSNVLIKIFFIYPNQEIIIQKIK